MLTVTVQNLGDVTVFQCQGRIVAGVESTILRNAVRSQTGSRTLVLDLARVDRVDAGGLGVLLGLHTWAFSKGMQFRLMNVTQWVQQVLEVTKLDGIIEICSDESLFQALPRLPQPAWSVGVLREPASCAAREV